MTPDEKAKQLICEFYLMNNANGNYIDETLAKQCALICVNKIIDVISEFSISQQDLNYKWWLKVQKELKNI